MCHNLGVMDGTDGVWMHVSSGVKVRMSERVWFEGELRVQLQGVMGKVKVTKVLGVATIMGEGWK